MPAAEAEAEAEAAGRRTNLMKSPGAEGGGDGRDVAIALPPLEPRRQVYAKVYTPLRATASSLRL